MICSPPKFQDAPRVGQVVDLGRVPGHWSLRQTGIAVAAAPVAHPVWRVVRVGEIDGVLVVVVAPFRA